MIKLWNIIQKNFQLLVRSRISALIVVLGPLFIILLVGIAFNTSNLFDIGIGAYSPSYSGLSDGILDDLSKESFSVVKMDSEDTCIGSVRSGENHVCLVFPADLKEGSEDTEIKFYVDKSRLNLAWIIIDSLSAEVSDRSTKLSEQLTQVLIDSVTMIEAKVADRSTFDESGVSIDLVKSKVEAAIAIMDGFNLSSSNGSLVEDLRTKIDDLEDDKNISLSGLDSIANQIELVLDDYEKRLSEMVLSKVDVKEQLDSVIGETNTQKTKLDALRGIFDEIEGEISSIEIKEAGVISQPITTSVQPVTTEKTYLSYMFPTLLVLVIMFVGILLSTTVVIREKTSRAFFRNFMAPVSKFIYVLGGFLTNLCIILVQLAIIFLVTALFFKDEILSGLGGVVVGLLIVVSVFVLLGMFLGYVFKSEETSIIGAVSVACILMFFSNTIIPVESMPSYLASIAMYNPYLIAGNLIKKLFLFNASLSSVTAEIYVLLSFAAAFVILIWGVISTKDFSYMLKKRKKK